jgi:hypothetical protein
MNLDDGDSEGPLSQVYDADGTGPGSAVPFDTPSLRGEAGPTDAQMHPRRGRDELGQQPSRY